MTYVPDVTNKEEVNVWKSKQEWLEKVMASKLSKATKIFAFGIFIHAYGNKTESFPGSEQIRKNTAFSSSGRFPEYRRTLESAGAFSVSKKRAGAFRQEHCVYELNLEWDGNTSGVTAQPSVSTLSTHLADGSNVPSGDGNVSSGEGNVPSGESSVSPEVGNTSNNYQEDFKEDLNDVNVAEHDTSIDKGHSTDTDDPGDSSPASLDRSSKGSAGSGLKKAMRLSGTRPPKTDDFEDQEAWIDAYVTYMESNRRRFRESSNPNVIFLGSRSTEDHRLHAETQWRTAIFRQKQQKATP